jgi:hypothetical protein
MVNRSPITTEIDARLIADAHPGVAIRPGIHAASVVGAFCWGSGRKALQYRLSHNNSFSRWARQYIRACGGHGFGGGFGGGHGFGGMHAGFARAGGIGHAGFARRAFAHGGFGPSA